MRLSADSYRHYGTHHGVALRMDASEPDSDAFLAYMETRIPAAHLDAYLDGVMDGLMGEERLGYLRGLRKVGSEDIKGDDV